MPWQPEAVALIDGEMYVKSGGEVLNIGEPPVEAWAIFAACQALGIPWGEFESCPEGQGAEAQSVPSVEWCPEGEGTEAQSVPIAHN
ncbi:MAG: hypothetical protein M5U12_33610 [Verrucomicrobia bacterium]|nr:hypothetical protein [Verrucomicrobiota bacterium]